MSTSFSQSFSDFLVERGEFIWPDGSWAARAKQTRRRDEPAFADDLAMLLLAWDGAPALEARWRLGAFPTQEADELLRNFGRHVCEVDKQLLDMLRAKRRASASYTELMRYDEALQAERLRFALRWLDAWEADPDLCVDAPRGNPFWVSRGSAGGARKW